MSIFHGVQLLCDLHDAFVTFCIDCTAERSLLLPCRIVEAYTAIYKSVVAVEALPLQGNTYHHPSLVIGHDRLDNKLALDFRRVT